MFVLYAILKWIFEPVARISSLKCVFFKMMFKEFGVGCNLVTSGKSDCII